MMLVGHVILTTHLLLPAAGAPPVSPARTLTVAAHEAARAVVLAAPQKPARKNWVQRHPVWTGAIAGFTAGYLIGYLPGDDAVFDDFQASFNGLVLGGVGAGIGALTGWIIAR